MDGFRDRLSAIASRKAEREKLLADLKAGKYAGIAAASEFFSEEQVAARAVLGPAVRPGGTLREMLGAEARETRSGPVLIRSIVIPAADRSAPWHPGGPDGDPVPEAALPILSKDIAAADFRAEDIAFIDTETTGVMGGAGTVVFVAGAAWWERDPWRLHFEQYVIEDFPHEGGLMEAMLERLSRFRVLCSYNGRAFDVPLLKARAVMHRMRPTALGGRHLDLLAPARRMWRGVLASCSLKAVERDILGVDRGPDIDGALIPAIFFAHARSRGAADRMAAVADHNVRDVVTLAGLLAHLGRIALDPAGCGLLRRPAEFRTAAKWMESRRDYGSAAALYRIALDRAEADSERFAMLLKIADLHRRAGEWPDAVAVWESMRSLPLRDALPAWIALAKYYEHRGRNPAAALRVVRQCRKQLDLEVQLALVRGFAPREGSEAILAELERREARLAKRLAAAEKKAAGRGGAGFPQPAPPSFSP